MYPDPTANPTTPNIAYGDGYKIRSQYGVYQTVIVGALVLCDGGRHEVFAWRSGQEGEGEFLGAYPVLAFAIQAGKHHPNAPPWHQNLTHFVRTLRHNQNHARALADAARRAEAEGMLTVAEIIKAALEDSSDG